MAKLVMDDCTVTIGAVDYTDEISSFTFEISTDQPETTNFSSGGWKEMLAGLRGYQISIEFKQDADLSGLDAAIWSEINTPTAGGIAWTARNEAASASAANPQYSGNVIVSGWKGLGGSVGDAFGQSVTWTGTGAPSRATS